MEGTLRVRDKEDIKRKCNILFKKFSEVKETLKGAEAIIKQMTPWIIKELTQFRLKKSNHKKNKLETNKNRDIVKLENSKNENLKSMGSK